MASVKKSVNKGGKTTYKVHFRHAGKQRSRTFIDLKSAKKWASLVDAIGADQALLQLGTVTHTGPTLDEIAEQYWAYIENRVRSKRTVHDYKREYHNWIAEPMGWMVASSINEKHIQDWVDSMMSKLSPKTIAHRHALLHGIFKWASAPSRQIIPLGHNPCTSTDLPKRLKPQPKGLRPAEWQALWIALHQVNPDAADLAEFMVASGWRWSEAVALDTYHCEDDGKHIWVTMSQVARRDERGAYNIVQDAKSTAGFRRIQLDAEVSKMVRKRLQNTQRGGFIFTSPEGYVWNYSHFRNRYWAPAIELANLQRKPTIHWLRHTAVAYLVMSRQIALPEIQKRIGHESIQTTIDVYGTLIQDVSEEALDAAAQIRGKRPESLTSDGENPLMINVAD